MVIRVSIVETGISLMEIDCHSLMVVISMSFVYLRELTYVVGTMLTHQLASIAVIFQLMLSMMLLTPHKETQSMWDCILPVEVLILSYFHFLLDIQIAKEHECISDSPLLSTCMAYSSKLIHSLNVTMFH